MDTKMKTHKTKTVWVGSIATPICIVCGEGTTILGLKCRGKRKRWIQK